MIRPAACSAFQGRIQGRTPFSRCSTICAVMRVVGSLTSLTRRQMLARPRFRVSHGLLPCWRTIRLRLGSPTSGPIFPASNGAPVCLNNVLNRFVKPALNRCEVCRKSQDADAKETHEFRRDASLPAWHGWHAFRRGLATNLHRLGVPNKTIQAILRHSNLSTTMNVYVKAVDADSVIAMKRLDALMCSPCAQNQDAVQSGRLN